MNTCMSKYNETTFHAASIIKHLTLNIMINFIKPILLKKTCFRLNLS